MGSENKITVDVEMAIAQAQKDIEKLTRQCTVFGADMTKAVGKADSAMNTFKGTLAALGVNNLFGKAKDAANAFFNTMVTGGIAAAAGYETSLNNLNVAMSLHGNFTKEGSSAMEAFASQIQRTTKYSDDAALSAAALIENISGLDKDALQSATLSAANLAAVLGTDLQSAAMIVGKAAIGETGRLGQFGLVIDQNASKAEKAAQALKFLSERFSGSAVGQAQTYSGAIAKTTHAFEDLQKNVGFLITQNPAVLAAINVVGKAFMKGADYIEHNKLGLIKFLNEGLVVFLRAIPPAISVVDFFYNAFRIAWNGVTIVARTAIATVLTLMQPFLAAFAPFSETAKAALGGVQDALKDLAKETEQDMKDVGAAFTEDSPIAKAGQTLIPIINQVTAAIEDSDNKIVQSNDMKNQAIKTSDNAAFLRQVEIINSKKQSFAEALLGDIAAANLHNELEVLKTEFSDEQATNRIEIARKIVEKENQLNQIRASNFKSTLTTISTLQKSSSRELFYIGKAAALAGAVIDGIAAVQKAMNATSNFYVNLGLAVLTGAAVAANVSNIAMQGPGFAQGGIVGGNSYSGDNVGIRVNSREGVFTLEQQQELFEISKGNRQSAGGGGGISVNVSGNLIVDSPSRIDELIEKISDAVKFRNVPLFASGLVGG